MGVVIGFVSHRAGHKSGLSSERDTPVSRSIGKTNSAGTPLLDLESQYQTWPCLVPIRSASRFCPPATSQAFFNASDMDASYPYLGENQPKNTLATEPANFDKVQGMRAIDKKSFGERVKRRRTTLKLTQTMLAEVLELPNQTTVDNWEQGKVQQPRIINELAEALNTTRDWLLWGDGPEEVAVKNPFEEIGSLLQKIQPTQTGPVIRLLKTLAQRKVDAA